MTADFLGSRLRIVQYSILIALPCRVYCRTRGSVVELKTAHFNQRINTRTKLKMLLKHFFFKRERERAIKISIKVEKDNEGEFYLKYKVA